MSKRATVGTELVFVSGERVRWTVREYPEDDATALAIAPCLVFGCESAVRRVRDFPANWRELKADALLELSWHR